MSDPPPRTPSSAAFALSPSEARLEAREQPKYLLAKTLFDCREYDRCAAVFLPGPLPKEIPPIESPKAGRTRTPLKGKARATTPAKAQPPRKPFQDVSQKSLFLALYAKYMSGEKRKDEESEMILGPADGGVTVNNELNAVSGILQQWFDEQHEKGGDGGGWLEYLYGIVLAKNKSEQLAKEWLIRSVKLNSWNWGAWLELANLLGNVEDVSVSHTFYVLYTMLTKF